MSRARIKFAIDLSCSSVLEKPNQEDLCSWFSLISNYFMEPSMSTSTVIFDGSSTSSKHCLIALYGLMF